MSQSNVQVLRPNRIKTYLAATGCLIASIVGAWVGIAGESSGWGILILFGIATLTFGCTALPNSTFLEIRPDGFMICTMFRSSSFKWSDVETFSVGFVGLRQMVVFNFSSGFKAAPSARRLASSLTGFEGALPDSYGMSLPDLANLLNANRNLYLGTNDGD
jgi:hypothetical protein